MIDSYFAFDRCGLLLGRIDQMIKKKGSDVDLDLDLDLDRDLDPCYDKLLPVIVSSAPPNLTI